MLGKLAMSLLGGSSVGAALMYLFDPDHGPKHRKMVKRTAVGAYRGAAESAAAVGEVRVRPKVKVRRKSEPDWLTMSLVAAGCCAAGAAAMFILDPAAGRRRRALVRDKAYSVAHRTGGAVGGRVSGAAR